MKCCFFGRNRTGKTTIIGTFPKPIALFSFEPSRTGGAESLSGVDGITVYRYGTPEDVAKGEAEFSTMNEATLMARELKAGNGCGFATVGVDSATSVEWCHLAELMTAAGRTMPDTLMVGVVPDGLYPMRSEKAKETLREFLDIPCHVVVTAKERDFNPRRRNAGARRRARFNPTCATPSCAVCNRNRGSLRSWDGRRPTGCATPADTWGTSTSTARRWKWRTP